MDGELHYVTYDPEEMWQAMVTAYIGAGGDLLYPGDEKEMLLRGVQAALVEGFAGVDNGLRMATLRYAVRDYLDVLGENRGCERIQAAPAAAKATITFLADGEQRTIPAGTALTVDGTLNYLLDADVTDDGAGTPREAAITCQEAGAAGNGLTAGTTMQFVTTQAGVVSTVCSQSAAGGENEEDDDSYRERIREWGLTNVVSGTEGQYESMAAAVSSEIADANAVNTGAGQVTVYLLIEDTDEQAAIVQAVTERLNEADARILGVQVAAAAATPVSYTLKAQVTVDVGAQASADFEAAAEEYRAWQDGKVGRAFNPDRLMAALYQAGASRVIWGAGSEFDGGAVQYTEIEGSGYCAGEVTVEVTVQ